MTFDLRLAQNWEDQSLNIKSILGLSDNPAQLGLYHGVGHALLDILYGLKEFWPLKKTLIVITNGDPHLSSCLRNFVRESYQIIALNSFDIGNIAEWVNGLKPDVLAVVYSADHAFTGELLVPLELSERLSAKKICSVEIQHSLHAYTRRIMLPWNVQVQHFFPDLAIALQGSRVRLFQHSAPLLDWSDRDLISEIQAWKNTHCNDVQAVKKFEANFNIENKWGVRAYFKIQDEQRLWDRAVVIAENIGGDHLINRLAEKLNIKLKKAGYSDLLETTHFCRWKVAREMAWWGKGIEKVSDFQSLIAISAHILTQEDFFKSFIQVLSACHKETELL